MQSARIELGQKTDPGRDPDKQVNEDSLVAIETRLGSLCVVCDGMGGHASGREASELAVRTVVDRVTGAPDDAPPGATLREAVREANAAVHAMARSEKGGRPGSTAVAILVHRGGTEVAHVGDSRCYLVHQGAIAQVTKDHSKVQLLVDAGYLRPEEAKTHPDANQIIRALGMTPDVDVELRPEPIVHVAGDAFVLCSDGLSDLVEPEEILQAVSGGSAQQAAGQLVDLANARGGHDNITVLVARAKESAVAVARLDIPTVAATAPGTEVMTAVPAPPTTPVPGAETPPGGTEVPAAARLVARTEIDAPAMPMPGVPAQAPPPAAVIPPGPPPLSVPPERSRSTILVVLGLVLALLVVVIAALLLLAKSRSHPTAPSTIDLGTSPASTEHLVADEDGGAPAAIASTEPLPTAPPTASGRRRHRRDAATDVAPTNSAPPPSLTPTPPPPPLPPP